MIYRLSAIFPLVVALALWLAVAPVAQAEVDDTPYNVAAGWKQAPYGDKVGKAFRNYLRASTYVGTAGIVHKSGFEEAKDLGFKMIINLNTAEEGAEKESVSAKAAIG